MSLPPAADIDTGVSNGDVDWLFRGKSKKLTKKLNTERVAGQSGSRRASSDKPSEERSIEDDSPEATAKPTAEKASASAEGSKPSSTRSDGENLEPQAGKAETKSEGKDSKFFKASRLRSSSAPQQPEKDSLPPNTTPSKRRSSLNFISAGAGGAPVEQEQPRPAQPTPNVSRTNSGRSKGFLSSLSSKFRLSSFSSAPAQSDPPVSPTLSPATAGLPKLNPNLLGSGQHPAAGQDLAALVNRPPLEIGIPVKSPRKSSVSSSPLLSVDKDRGGFFRRRSLVIDVSKITGSPKLEEPFRLNRNPNREKSLLPEIRVPKLRRVSFALDKLDDDPQQQIPSRRPRKGNVLIPEDLTAPIPRLAQGISATDGSRTAATETKYSEKELQLAVEAQKRALLEADKHAMEAHLSAKRLASQIVNYKNFGKSIPGIEEEEAETSAGNIEIDKPLHLHENHFLELTEELPESSSEELSLETIYTRCCHLREILPIPATLKQLKNKLRPLQVIKLLNPKPTLIDVLSFSDFIAITPINTVIFDNVTMTTEMLKHLLTALVHNKHLEKLSLRNVAIDFRGWFYLCEFLSRNLTVKKLDVSQQRVKQVTKAPTFRSQMNWDLFIKALVARKGIEELVLGGCKLSDEVFQNLLENAITISTCRLGMAATEINVRKCEVIADWISRPNSKCVGIDIAFNDLSQGQLQPFIKAFNTKTVNLIFFSLNSTSLSDVEEVGELLRGLSRVQTLKFLDFSSLPQLFPKVIPKLSKHLPNFPSLRRIHFDLNELNSQSVDAIADVLPKVQGLVHVSLLGNRDLDRGSIGALYTAIKQSTIFTLDLDYDLVPDELSQRLALYLVRNMDRVIRPDVNDIGGESDQDDVMFDGSLLMETAEKLLTESDKNQGETDLKLQRVITNALIERTASVRKDIHKIIDKLFERRNQGNLSFEGKENLLRFCFLDAALEKVNYMFEQKAKMFGDTPLSPSPSVSENTSAMVGKDREQLHESSSALIDAGPILMAKNSRPNMALGFCQNNEPTFQPHVVVTEANPDGRNVPIDNFTGRPVLMKSVSQASVHAREQEEEEGEFLRWGHFIESRETKDEMAAEEERQDLPVFGAVPSGSELREAIIDAKGIESVTQLITKINTNRVSLDKIYNTLGLDSKHEINCPSAGSPPRLGTQDVACEDALDNHASDAGSIDSENHEVHPVVDEAYDKLLNEAQRVRSNK